MTEALRSLIKFENLLKKYGRYVIWVDESEDANRRPYEDVKNIGNIIFSSYPKSQHWGDDWNDTPANCNASWPYEGRDPAGNPREDPGWLQLSIDEDTRLYTSKDVVNIVNDYVDPNIKFEVDKSEKIRQVKIFSGYSLGRNLEAEVNKFLQQHEVVSIKPYEKDGSSCVLVDYLA